MKRFLAAYVIFGTIVFLSSCENLFDPLEIGEESIPFTTYYGYSVKSSFGENDSTYFLAFKDKESFDRVLFRIADHNPNEPIPDNDFKTKIIIAVIKKGNRFWEMKVDKVTLKENVIYVKYSAKIVADNMSWTAVIPLIFSIPIIEYSSITFVENGVTVGSIPN